MYKICLLGHKRDGEPLKWAFYRGYAVVEGAALSKSIKRILLGKYAVKLGLGLVTTNGMRAGALTAAFGVPGHVLKPCENKGRNGGLQGLGVNFTHGNIEGVFYVAHNDYFAIIKKVKTPKKGKRKKKGKPVVKEESRTQDPSAKMLPEDTFFVKSLPLDTGFRNERDNKKQGFQEQVVGGGLWYKPDPKVTIGVQYLQHRYNLLFKKNGFEGKGNANMSVWGSLKREKHHLRSEVACSANGGLGFFLGDKFILGKKDYIIGAIQRYSPYFYSFHGEGVASSKGKNEERLSLASQHTLGGVTLKSSLDLSRPLAASTKAGFTIKGQLEATHKPSQKWKLEGKFTCGHTPSGPPKSSVKLSSTYAQDAIALKTTLACATPDLQQLHSSLSFGVSENITYTKGPLRLTLHGSLFSAPDAQLYFHTPDLQVPALSPAVKGQGICLGATCTYKMCSNLFLQWQGYCKKKWSIPGFGLPAMKFKLQFNA